MKKVSLFICLFFILFLIVYVTFVGNILSCKDLFAQDDNVSKTSSTFTYCVDGGNMYFYDPTEQIIYIYSTRGEFRRAYELETLGMRLKSIHSSEIRKMIAE